MSGSRPVPVEAVARGCAVARQVTVTGGGGGARAVDAGAEDPDG